MTLVADSASGTVPLWQPERVIMIDDRASWVYPDVVAFGAFSRLLVAASAAAWNVWGIAALHGLNFCRGAKNEPSEGLRAMDDIERDGAITINVGFGNITFYRDETGSFAQAAVDLTAQGRSHDRIELAFRVDASHHDSIVEVVEKSRCHLVDLLKAAVARMEAETAETLLYQQEAP